MCNTEVEQENEPYSFKLKFTQKIHVLPFTENRQSMRDILWHNFRFSLCDSDYYFVIIPFIERAQKPLRKYSLMPFGKSFVVYRLVLCKFAFCIFANAEEEEE